MIVFVNAPARRNVVRRVERSSFRRDAATRANVNLVRMNEVSIDKIISSICPMPDAYRIHKREATYFLTFTIVGWADALLRTEHKKLICDSLKFCVDNKGLEIFSYAIMTSHIHLLARAKKANLCEIIRDFKKFTSSQLIYSMKAGNESRKEWMVKLFNEQNGKQKKKSGNTTATLKKPLV